MSIEQVNNDNKEHYVALLTGTIDSSVYNNVGNRIQNIDERLKQYEHSIENYIKYSAFNVIVFAENSGFNFNSEKFEKLADSYGKAFEFVSCPAYVEQTVKHGKSYGEARVIDDGIKNSKFLANEDCIYKLTGRIFLRNSKQICKTKNKHKNEFIVYDCSNWCFTNIFKFSKQDYLKYWDKIYERCDEKSVNDIEITFFNNISNLPANSIDIGSFAVWPNFDGIQGATLEPYSGSKLELMLRTILCKLKVFTYGTWTSKLLKLK